jgi:hypothetical protein
MLRHDLLGQFHNSDSTVYISSNVASGYARSRAICVEYYLVILQLITPGTMQITG